MATSNKKLLENYLVQWKKNYSVQNTILRQHPYWNHKAFCNTPIEETKTQIKYHVPEECKLKILTVEGHPTTTTHAGEEHSQRH